MYEVWYREMCGPVGMPAVTLAVGTGMGPGDLGPGVVAREGASTGTSVLPLVGPPYLVINGGSRVLPEE